MHRNRKSEIQNLKSAPPRVQIQTQSGCNGRCVYCPNEAVLKSDLKQGRMDPELYRKIIDALAGLSPRRISPYLMNEPLLDPRLPDFIRYTAEKVPDATTLVTTNGTHLKEDLAEALIDSGLKRLKVSLQSLDPKTNHELMGPWVDSGKVVENVLAMKRLMRQKRAKRPELRVSMIVTSRNKGEIPRAQRFWKKHGIRVVTSALENRGGNIDAGILRGSGDNAGLNPHNMCDRAGACIRPFREMCILWNGDVVLCCVDWFRTSIIGNVAQQSIEEIWNGPRIQQIRQALQNRDRDNQPRICLNCTESAQPHAHRRGIKGLLNRLTGGE